MGLDPKLTFAQHKKDTLYYERYGQKVIDKMIIQCGHTESHDSAIVDTVGKTWGPSPDCLPTIIFTLLSEHLHVAC